jgi:asparagine synthase (glutamine-hydrolysing)
MCGFFFCYKKNNIPVDRKLFLKSSKLLSHRGPDSFNHFFDKNILGSFYRLSIQDVSKLGSQPMLSFSKKNIIFFNGEIYNYKELRKMLSIKLKSNSDTEVIVNLIEIYGTKILDKVKGMFAIIIYNFETKEIILIRDRFGMKPLYYYEDKNFFVASSEIKPIKSFSNTKQFNDSAFGDFFFKGYMHHDKKTFFKDIKQIENSTVLRIRNDKKFFNKYWEIKTNKTKKNSYKESKKKLSSLFKTSIKQHLVSDVEVGSFLSGGNDSSTISIIAKKFEEKIKTFTYDFEGYKNLTDSELNLAKNFAKKNNLENYSKILSYKDIEDNIDKVIKIVETPITSIRLIAFYKLYKLVKSKNIKVILEGMGGDELFGGYKYNWLPGFIDNNYNNNKSKKLIYKIFSRGNIKKFGLRTLINFVYGLNSEGNHTSDGTPYLHFNLFNNDFIDFYFSSKENFKNDALDNFDFLQKSQLKDIKNIHIPRALNYVDKIAMSNSIETRLPYLDHELFEYCFGLPSNYKLKNNIQRFIWKDRFKRYAFKTNKKSIVDPQREWLKKNIHNIFRDDFNSLKVQNSGYFNKKNIDLFLKNYQSSSQLNNSFGLIQIFSASKFINIFNY